MSKPIKELVRKELVSRFQGITSLAVVGFTGLDATANEQVRARLRDKGIRLTVVKNILARRAFDEIGLAQAGQMLDGPCAIAYGGDNVVSIVRELLDIGKEAPTLTVKAALLEGEIFGAERIDELSKYPTRDEAVATVLTCALSPARKLVGCLMAPAARIAGILKTITQDTPAEPSSETQAQDTPAEPSNDGLTGGDAEMKCE